ncbi:MAG TPA: hypothetical protein VGX68_22300 [Thermoanaerobaculia bacterium]|nr:hypothetical protein [Thermoanaerobaculia bacterium]
MKNTVRGVIYLHALVALATLLISPVAASESEPSREDIPCGTRYSKPEEAAIKGCNEAYCVKTAATARVCSCRKSQDASSAEMLVERDGAIEQRWDSGFILPASLATFGVDGADLTGTGRQDLVVATLITMSNGMGIEYWEVRAIVGDKLTKPLDVEDYGIMSYLTRASPNSKCRLLASRWFPGWEPERGEGLYLMGKWFTYSEFSPELTTEDRPAVYRRYLLSFQRLRAEQLRKDLDHRQPLPWFSDGRTKELVGPYPSYERE